MTGVPTDARPRALVLTRPAGGVAIEIITQPGLGPIRYYSNLLVRDGSISGRSPFVPIKGPEQNVNYGFGMGGTLIKEKTVTINRKGDSIYGMDLIRANGTFTAQ